MLELFFQLQKEALPSLRAGNLAECDRIFSDAMRHLPPGSFHIALDLRFTNSPRDVAAHFDAFFRQEVERYAIAAAYTETNGFSINTDRWFFNLFAYTQYGGQEDYDWLSDYQSESFPDITLTGMEALQEVYASPPFGESAFDDTSSVADLLVKIRFQQLVQQSVPFMSELRFPLLATSHDSDFIGEFRRNE